MNKKGFAGIGLIIAIVLVAGAIGGGVYFFTKSKQDISNPKVNTTKTYKDTQYKFEFSYPEEIKISKAYLEELKATLKELANFEAKGDYVYIPLHILKANNLIKAIPLNIIVSPTNESFYKFELNLLSFSVVQKPDNFTDIEKYVKDGSMGVGVIEKTRLGQIDAIRKSNINNGVENVSLWIDNGTNLFYISYDHGVSNLSAPRKEYEDLRYQTVQDILSTFKFTK